MTCIPHIRTWRRHDAKRPSETRTEAHATPANRLEIQRPGPGGPRAAVTSDADHAVITPWIAILAIGALRTRSYDVDDLQALAHGQRGGRYWFTNGWHVGAVAAWLVGGAFGLLAGTTTLYVGPLADVAGGIDLSTIGSAVIAGVMYAASLRFIRA